MTAMKNPCGRDCPDRSETCHGTCEKYKAFYSENAERLARKRRILDADNDFTAYSIDAQRNMKRKKW